MANNYNFNATSPYGGGAPYGQRPYGNHLVPTEWAQEFQNGTSPAQVGPLATPPAAISTYAPPGGSGASNYSSYSAGGAGAGGAGGGPQPLFGGGSTLANVGNYLTNPTTLQLLAGIAQGIGQQHQANQQAGFTKEQIALAAQAQAFGQQQTTNQLRLQAAQANALNPQRQQLLATLLGKLGVGGAGGGGTPVVPPMQVAATQGAPAGFGGLLNAGPRGARVG